MARAVEAYFKLLRLLTVVCMAAMVILVFGNVVLRYGFNSGITASEELSRWFFVWLTFFGAAAAMKNHAHLGMDSVVSRLPVAGKRVCFVVSNILMLVATYLFFTGTWEQTKINLDNHAPATNLSMGFFYGVGLIFCVTAAGVLIYDLVRVLRGQMSESELVQVKESEDADEIKHKVEDAQAATAVSLPQGGKGGAR